MPLTLAKETMDMNWKDTAASGSSQILLEGDIIVPDSKPDLQEILRCQGNVKIREKRVTDDRISFSGDLEISVLYRAKNGERPLYAMQASLPLEDFLHIDGLEKDMETSLDAAPEHLDCQIINDRKIGVKAVLGVTATGERQNHTEILSIDRKLSCLTVFIYGRGQLCILNLQSAGQFGFRLDAFPLQIAAKRDFFAEVAEIALGIAIQHTNAQIAAHHYLTIHGANILLCEVDGLPEDICNFGLGGGKGDFLLDGEAVFQGSGVLLHPQYALQTFNALTADTAQNFWI